MIDASGETATQSSLPFLTTLEVVLIDRRRRGWEWQVRDQSSHTFIGGREKTRQAAKYAGERALFQLLAVGQRLVGLQRPN